MDIKLSPFGKQDPNEPDTYNSGHDWTDIDLLQGGRRGVVLSKNGSYRTAFVEAFGEDIGFVRGEGETVQDAAQVAWDKIQRIRACEGHEWEPRGYTNGLGFCRHCSLTKSKAFTAADLGQFCSDCGVPCYEYIRRPSKDYPQIFRCAVHMPGQDILSALSDDVDILSDFYWEQLDKADAAQMAFWETYEPSAKD